MAWTAARAKAELANVESIEQLRALIENIDIAVDGRPTFLFSGGDTDGSWYGAFIDEMADNQPSIRSIRSSEIADFLDLDSNDQLVETLLRLFNDDPTKPGTASYEFLNGSVDVNGIRIPNGVWDDASERFARDTVGEVRVLTSLNKPYGVFTLSELPALLANPNVTEIDGVPKADLARLYRQTDLPTVAKAVALNSQVHMTLSGLATGDVSAHLGFGPDDFEEALKDPIKREAVTAILNDADPEIRAVARAGLGALLDGAEISHLNGVSKVLNRLGYVGGILSFVLISSQAASAGTEEERKQILEEWAVDAIGGEIGSVIGAAAAGIAVAAVGVASAPVATALILGASMVGGFVGPSWATGFYQTLGDSEQADRARVLGQLTELYFGEGATVIEDRIPPAGASFTWIDPEMSPAEIQHVAQSDVAWRYALVKLNPFVVDGVDYASIHNLHGELDLFDGTTGDGLTDQYLLARAEALHAYVGMFNDGVDLASRDFPGGYGKHFLDAELSSGAGAIDHVLDLSAASDDVGQRLFGTDGGEVIRGANASDMLFGGDGADHLDGQGGADYLEGGRGDDVYVVGDGDMLFDAGGVGTVLFAEARLNGGSRVGESSAFVSPEGDIRYERAGADLRITRIADGAQVKILGFDNGDLGISLDEPLLSSPVAHLHQEGGAASEMLNGQIDASVSDRQVLNGWNLPDHIEGQEGRDWIYAWDDGTQMIEGGVVVNSAPDTDIVEGGPGRDYIHGGAGDDLLYATRVVDRDSVMLGQGALDPDLSGIEEGDFVSGQSGNDTLYGSARLDGLFGGDGDDLIFGGSGDDIIDGDRSAVISPLSLDIASYDYAWYVTDENGARQLQLFGYSAGSGTDQIHAGDGDDLVWGGAADDVIRGDAGDDQLNGDMSGSDGDGNPILPGQFHGDDVISGGAGDDALNGNGGHDMLFGGDGNDVLDGDYRILIGDDAAYHGNDYLDGGNGDDLLSGSGGSDVLLGGDGNDTLFGDLHGLDAAYHGADVLYGGSGNDQMVGQGGGDMLDGGDGNDLLYGDAVDLSLPGGDDGLFGGPGADELSGGQGNDFLDGGDGPDQLWGNVGNDRLAGGRELDYLEGGAGADSYIFSAGDSPWTGSQTETVVDAAGQQNTIVFTSGVDRNAIQLTLANDGGDLVLRYTESDRIWVSGGLTGAIATYSFGDGVVLSYQELLSAALPAARFLTGGEGFDIVFGGPDGELLQGGAADDRLIAGAGDDVLDGGAGVNRLIGGPGADTYLINVDSLVAGPVQSRHEIVDSLDRTSVVRFGAGIEPTDLSWNPTGNGQGVVLSTSFVSVSLRDGADGGLVNRFEFASGEVFDFVQLQALLTAEAAPIHGTPGDDTLNGTFNRDSLYGGLGNDELLGGDGADLLDGGPGADRMVGGRGSDNYVVDNSGDLVVESEDAGIDRVKASVDYVLPGHVEHLSLTGTQAISGGGNALANYILGNSAANLLMGGAGDDWIEGEGGLDVIDGGDGDDYLRGDFRVSGGAGDDHIVSYSSSTDGDQPVYQLSGGMGDDIYEVWQPYQIYYLGSINEAENEGEDTLILHGDRYSLWPGLPGNVENLRYEYTSELWAGTDALVLRGNALDNRIEIGRPNPDAATELHGLQGDDVLVGSSADESGDASCGLYGEEGDDLLQGMGGADNLYGGPGDDLLEGGPGADLLVGGSGTDSYLFSLGDSQVSGGMSVIEDEDGGSVIRFSAGIGPRDLRIDYVGQDMQLSYSAVDTVLIAGGAAADQVARYEFELGAVFTPDEMNKLLSGNAAPVVSGTALSVHAWEGRPASWTLPADLITDPDRDPLHYDLALAGTEALPAWVQFDALSLTLAVDPDYGDAGDFVLSLSAIDPYGARAAAEVAMTVAPAGLVVGTLADDVLKGTAAAENMDGDDGDDRLYGYAGDDWLIAGNGNDRLYGGDDNDLLNGGDGHDILNGQTGDDQMIGGRGDDRYYVDSAADVLRELVDEGLDRVFSDVDFVLGANFENLTLRGVSDLNGTGNDADNRLYGNAGANALYGEAGDDRLYGRDGDDVLYGGTGNDILVGQAGGDRMIGGPGDDRYYVDVPEDVLVEQPNAGLDRVYSDVDFALAADFEDLILRGSLDLSGFGNAADNRLYGNDGANVLRGGDGSDRLYGRDNDDRLWGGAGNDILSGDNGADQLFGDAGNDVLHGRDGDDLVVGGPGDDLLNGGYGNDEYRFGLGDGIDRIRNGADSQAAELDQLSFSGDIGPDQVWFSRQGKDLLVQLVGNVDQVRVSGWYASESQRIDRFKAAEGESIVADQVERLVNAVASFNISRAAVIDLSPMQRDEYATLVTAYWQGPATPPV